MSKLNKKRKENQSFRSTVTPAIKQIPAIFKKYRYNGSGEGGKMAPTYRTTGEVELDDNEISLPASEDSIRGKDHTDHP